MVHVLDHIDFSIYNIAWKKTSDKREWNNICKCLQYLPML